MKKYKHYLNGTFVNEKNLLISPRDLGFTRSFAVFTKLKTYNIRPFKLKEHLSKLIKSANLIGLKHGYTINNLTKIVRETLRVNKDKNEKTLKIMLSGGVSDSMYQSNETTLIIIVDLLKPRKAEIYKDGVKLILVKFTRHIPEAKSTNYIEGVKQTQLGIKNGFFEPLFYSDEQIYEGSNSNIFVVKKGKIYTPLNNVYHGIMRDVIVQNLRSGLKIIEEDFNLDFLLNTEEIFITGSGKEIVPVIKVNDHAIGNGKVGKITKLIMDEFKKFINSDKW